VEECIGGWELTSNVTWTPTFRKEGKDCAESQATLRGPNRTRFLTVQAAIRVKMQCDKKSFLGSEDVSKKRNLMTVGGHTDYDVDLCGQDNVHTKCQNLGKGQTILTKSPRQVEFEGCWSEKRPMSSHNNNKF
jgi:hypothetical protein